MNEILDFFIEPYKSSTTLNIILEAIAFIFGILSVWYAKKAGLGEKSEFNNDCPFGSYGGLSRENQVMFFTPSDIARA